MPATWESAAARAASSEADLGLPIAKRTRLRLLKRAAVRISWSYLQHQIEFNRHILDAFGELIAELQRQFALARHELSQELAEQLDRGLRQAYREIGDQVARSRSDVTLLQRELFELKAEVRKLGGKG